MPVTMERLKQAKDAALIRLFQLGNSKAFDILVNRYQPKLRAYLHILLHDAVLEKDILQLLLMELLKQFREHRYRENGNFLTWVQTLAYRAAVSAKRKKKIIIVAADEASLPGAPDEKPGMDDVTAAVIERVRKSMAAMNKNFREVLKMRIDEEMSFREISEKTHTDINTVTSRYSKAIKKLRKAAGKRNK